MRKALLFLVDDQIDRALIPARHRFGLVLSGFSKTQVGEQSFKVVRSSFVDSKFDEFDAETLRARRELWKSGYSLACFCLQLIQQVDERTMAVDGHGAWRPCTKLIVEDLERQIAVVSRRLQSFHEVHKRQITLAGQ